MTKKTAQRIGIWIIAVVMALGTLGAYFAIILQNENQTADTARQQTQQEELARQQQEAQKKQAEARAKTLRPLEGYEATPFSTPVNDLNVTTLKDGQGETVVTSSSKVTINYTGWLPDGKIFDSTNENGKVTPYAGPDEGGVAVNGFVPGFTQGLIGAKEGEVRKLIIPASEAYGAQGSGIIPPNTPIAFIVEVVKVN